MIRRQRWSSPSTTAYADRAEGTFEVTHPHHPLRGQNFKLVTYRHNWGEDRVYFHDSSGVLRSIPACWTVSPLRRIPAFVVIADQERVSAELHSQTRPGCCRG